jgi:L-2-hydroxyglutarate oxidase
MSHASPNPFTQADVAVIGGGIIGLSTARALVAAGRGPVVVLEAEPRLAAHQTGRNSGVIHSGIYYTPGSFKARLCARGREMMFAFCAEHGTPVERCGKVIVATEPDQIPALDELERRGVANGLDGLCRLGPEQIREHEPHARGVAGLWVPETGITDFARVSRALAEDLGCAGAEVRTGSRVVAVGREAGGFRLETAAGPLRAAHLVNCAGLHSDRVAALCGVRAGVRIVPFRGEYYDLGPGARALVRGLIYPVPDPRFPFLGVHFTRRVDGSVEAGPNAVLALSRHGYSRGAVRLGQCAALAGFPGFWRMARRYWRTGLEEAARSASRGAFARALSRLVPGITAADLRDRRAGVRAQAVGRDGRLVDDFVIQRAERAVHVLNAPSPGATAALAIGEEVARCAQAVFAPRALAAAVPAVFRDNREDLLMPASPGAKGN